MFSKHFSKILPVIALIFLFPFTDSASASDESDTIGGIQKVATESIEHVNEVLGGFLFATIRDALCEPDVVCTNWFMQLVQDNYVGNIITQMPFLILWMIVGSIFFTLRLGFVNVRLFTHAFPVIRGRYSKDSDPGEVTHFQALSSAVSATVGLGNIAGVAVAVSVGGPGAIFWMMIAGFLGMNTKFAEVTMGLKYREVFPDGKVNGGAYEYLSKGLAEMNMARLGKVLAFIFAFCCVGASMASGNLFQSNQATVMIADTFEPLHGYQWAISLTMAILVGIILFGGIKRIAEVAVKIVPFMAITYVTSCLIIIFYNIDNLGTALSAMFDGAFAAESATGGILGAIINGFKRAAFSSEAGIGSAPTAHSAAKTKEPVREGVVALIEPFIDTIVVCFVSGLAIVITGVYINSEASGVVLTNQAFTTVSDWFSYALALAIVLFAFSTILTWGYYGAKAFAYLFGEKTQPFFKIVFCVFTFLGGIMSLDIVVEFSDLLLLSMAVPNLLGLYILSGKLSKEVDEYTRKLKAGKFKMVK